MIATGGGEKMKNNLPNRKTKILITMGPSIESMLEKSLNIIDGVRFNMSHAKIEEMDKYMEILNKNNIAKLMDLKGNKLRIKTANISTIKTGETVIIGKDIILSHHPVEEVEIGHFILINDGKIKLKIDNIKDNLIYTTAIVGGEIKQGNGINTPDSYLKMPIISIEDIEHIKYAIKHDFEYIALSFVRNKNDIINLKNILHEHNGDMSIIAKIETKEGLNNIEEISMYADGIMVARGDLGVEIPIENIPIKQKEIIRTANKYGKIVITATQMLDSMINNPYPTRAELTDIANAIYDGTDCIMLSNETSVGKYPIEAIKVMDKVAKISEKDIDKFGTKTKLESCSTSIGIAYATYALFEKLHPKIILTPTWSGSSAKLISKFKPLIPIIAPTPNIKTFRKLRLIWGITPVLSDEVHSIDDILNLSKEIAKNYIDTGIYIITLGHPIGMKKTNLIKVETIE
jgi:pyruvate kinase